MVQEYERAVIFRLGRVQHGARGPGKFTPFYHNPCMALDVTECCDRISRCGTHVLEIWSPGPGRVNQ